MLEQTKEIKIYRNQNSGDDTNNLEVKNLERVTNFLDRNFENEKI